MKPILLHGFRVLGAGASILALICEGISRCLSFWPRAEKTFRGFSYLFLAHAVRASIRMMQLSK